MATRKTMRLLQSLAANKYGPSIPFLRILPTDFCNLVCSYCWQHNSDRHFMDEQLFDSCLAKAMEFHVGLISFLGGEPTIWPHLLDSIKKCSARHIGTDVTTNGSRLTPDYLDDLAKAGLDLLNISVDGLVESKISRKACLSDPKLLQAIASILRAKRMRVRLNSVICKDNWPFIRQLLDIAEDTGIPISLGYAMYRTPSEFDGRIHFSKNDAGLVSEICDDIRHAKQRGVKIIDPMDYFEGFHKFLKGERFWVCNYATRRGWINVDPYGFIRDCTKKFGRIDTYFPELTFDGLLRVRAQLAAGVEKCNVDCYSNCAFDGAYFATHKMQFLASGITG